MGGDSAGAATAAAARATAGGATRPREAESRAEILGNLVAAASVLGVAEMREALEVLRGLALARKPRRRGRRAGARRRRDQVQAGADVPDTGDVEQPVQRQYTQQELYDLRPLIDAPERRVECRPWDAAHVVLYRASPPAAVDCGLCPIEYNRPWRTPAQLAKGESERRVLIEGDRNDALETMSAAGGSSAPISSATAVTPAAGRSSVPSSSSMPSAAETLAACASSAGTPSAARPSVPPAAAASSATSSSAAVTQSTVRGGTCSQPSCRRIRFSGTMCSWCGSPLVPPSATGPAKWSW
eukprot:gene25204-biopygen15011